MPRFAFTLIELLIVVIIIGVLATLGLTHYGGIREQTLDREGAANLRLIRAAERTYHMENLEFYASSVDCDPANPQPTVIARINFCLRLSLSPAANRIWNYATFANNANADPALRTFCAQATRNGGDGRLFHISNAHPDPEEVVSGACW